MTAVGELQTMKPSACTADEHRAKVDNRNVHQAPGLRTSGEFIGARHTNVLFSQKKRPYLSIDRGGIIVGSSSCYTLAFDLTSPDVILSYNETGCYRVLVASGTRSV